MNVLNFSRKLPDGAAIGANQKQLFGREPVRMRACRSSIVEANLPPFGGARRLGQIPPLGA